ncbi:MAG TPA: pseudaminic acid synthase [Kofleriaceae bacterium]|jgi:N-acetylneuraminate synthase
MKPVIHIAGRAIGPEHAPWVIAELSANHLGKLERAHAIIDAAADAGCHAMKLQTFTPQSMTLDTTEGNFTIAGGPWGGRSLWDLYSEAHTPWEWHAELFKHANDRGMVCFSTPFDEESIGKLDKLGAPCFKIASFELVDLELIAAAARTNKPLIMSTGMASDAEVAEALDVARTHGNGGIALLHCISGYPAPIDQTNVRRMDAIAKHGTVVGVSDHSPGAIVPITAVARGGSIIEKHLILSRTDGGPDAGFSLEPHEMKDVVEGTRLAWSALGDGSAKRPKAEDGNRRFRRSLYAVADVAAGQPLTRENVRSIRPGYGLAPRELPVVIGRVAKNDIARGTPLAWELFA